MAKRRHSRALVFEQLETKSTPSSLLLALAPVSETAHGTLEKIRAGDVLGALTGDMGFAKEQIGKINVNEFSTYVAVAREIADKALKALNDGKVKGKRVKARPVEN